MHELSIAQGILELVEEQVRRRSLSSVEEVEIDVGRLAGVETQALTIAIECVARNTVMENARIVRNDIEGEGLCGDCGRCFVIEELFAPCPDCGSCAVRVVKGKELRVKSILSNK
ncbi:MAG: hydrogenase maturation nickel metallochaperone HypA [Tannerellaceae bacterium]|jgi:hydrogenase nickel incorporation protein HypA/HybF|nr:hydrogenase maturation nickel metallochaperone HypA [Tannerellaceae bacterium]